MRQGSRFSNLVVIGCFMTIMSTIGGVGGGKPRLALNRERSFHEQLSDHQSGRGLRGG
jgi:hypothetical protein